ncbi:hypothetical protein LJR045_002934 [Microbacterium sp. LjRoot45]|uniref:hypothetical protein n=1 Tax=Microbacterium sp. LjRoot45 TaxID=3342329 RepID=UPI003ECF2077
MDPALPLSIGTFVVSAGAAAIAWWQAIEAGRRRDAAETASKAAEEARKKAVTAQESAATALTEANAIAREARDIVAASEARKIEVNDVHWEPTWVSAQGEFRLYNHGEDPALNVKVRVRAIGKLRTEKADQVPSEGHVVFEFPPYKGQGGFPRIEWEVTWVTPLGTPQSLEGVWR